jgi:hypothetical protein
MDHLQEFFFLNSCSEMWRLKRQLLCLAWTGKDRFSAKKKPARKSGGLSY